MDASDSLNYHHWYHYHNKYQKWSWYIFKPVSPIPNSNVLNLNIIWILIIFKYTIQMELFLSALLETAWNSLREAWRKSSSVSDQTSELWTIITTTLKTLLNRTFLPGNAVCFRPAFCCPNPTPFLRKTPSNEVCYITLCNCPPSDKQLVNDCWSLVNNQTLQTVISLSAFWASVQCIYRLNEQSYDLLYQAILFA